MARLPRVAVAGHLHLVAQRAMDGLPVFALDADRVAYRAALRDAARANRVDVHAYGLYYGEARLLVTPAEADGLARTIQSVGRRFVSEFNRRHGRAGPVWQGRFRATVVDPDAAFLPCLRFVEGDAAAAEATASSAGHHRGVRPDPLITDHPVYWRLGNTPFEREAAYRALAEQLLTPDQLSAIEAALGSGWALGSTDFVSSVEGVLHRRLRPLQRGRPRSGRVVAN